MQDKDPNYWWTDSITGDGRIVIVSDRDGGVIEKAETEAEAEARTAVLNAEDEGPGRA